MLPLIRIKGFDTLPLHLIPLNHILSTRLSASNPLPASRSFMQYYKADEISCDVNFTEAVCLIP